MINFSKYKIILWDFDGVVMDSMPVRDRGFEIVLAQFPKEHVDALMVYHRANGGLSRYVKFRYFFEEVLKQSVTDEKVQQLASQFSTVMRKELVNAELFIEETVAFIKANHHNRIMHVVSGSDQQELRYLCDTLRLSQYFVSIHGSPTPKKQLVFELLQHYGYDTNEIVFIGDSKNDYDAASLHGIDFFGFNNPELINTGVGYIHSYNDIILSP
jgi:HAD superfamily hydrolase (TIGR01549 family)